MSYEAYLVAQSLAYAMGVGLFGMLVGLFLFAVRSNERYPRALLVWGRLLHAAHLLDGGRTVESTSYALGYASGSGLHRAFHRRVGFPPGDVSLRGGLTPVVNALLESAEITRLRV